MNDLLKVFGFRVIGNPREKWDFVIVGQARKYFLKLWFFAIALADK